MRGFIEIPKNGEDLGDHGECKGDEQGALTRMRAESNGGIVTRTHAMNLSPESLNRRSGSFSPGGLAFGDP